MTIKPKSEDEPLIQKRLQSGAFASAEEVIHQVIHHALESLDTEDEWFNKNRQAVHEKIERAFGQFERGEGLTAEESLTRLEAKKVAWRADQLRG